MFTTITAAHHFISIKRKNFGNDNNKMFLLFIALFCFLGIMGIFINWRAGLCAVAILCIAYFLLKNNILKITAVLFIVALGIFGCCYFLNLDFIEIFLTTVFLSFSFFLKPLYASTKENLDFELFFFDKKNLKCLATKDNDYKGYALNPKDYLKTYLTKDIESFTFQGKNLSINIGGRIIRPREVTIKDIEEINFFVTQHFPDLLTNESTFKDNLKAENKFYLNKLLICSPIIILSTVIYFFCENGRDKMITYVCMVLMLILPIIIYRILKPK